MTTIPAPPSLPDGWIACWDEEYKAYFYINKRTHDSQWEIPTAPFDDYSDISIKFEDEQIESEGVLPASQLKQDQNRQPPTAGLAKGSAAVAGYVVGRLNRGRYRRRHRRLERQVAPNGGSYLPGCSCPHAQDKTSGKPLGFARGFEAGVKGSFYKYSPS